MEYCLGNGFELSSALCDSDVPRFERFSHAEMSFVNHASVFEVDDVVVFPCMICNVGALCVFCCVPNVFFSSGVK